MAKKKLTKKDEQAKVVDMSNIDDIDPKVIEKARKETRAAMKEKKSLISGLKFLMKTHQTSSYRKQRKIFRNR
jgi:transketolase C-terminal domain/subunit